jgi:DNA-binding NtrC family response regulator
MPVFDTSKSASESSPVLPARLEGMRLQQVSRYSFDLLASVAPPMQRLTQQVRLASQVSANVLLVGERGTGKESLARLIHYQGGSRERSFVALDCRVLPPACVADVLLAERSGPLWPGLGAIYLDEPAFLPRDLQLRLCEWLAEHGDRAVPRLFVGSCQEPSEDVRAGRLLDELHWRLGTVILHVPTLRQRLADLPALVERFLAAGVGKDRGPVQGLTTAAWEALRAYPWPGNLAELRRVLETARLQARGDHLDVDDFPLSIRLARQLELDPARSGPRTLVLEEVLEQVERRLIQLALLRARGNRSQAAELLGIHRPRLLRRMEALKIDSREETD